MLVPKYTIDGSEETLSVWLDRAISAAGVTQGQVATATGLAGSAISEYRSGKSVPDPQKCWLLAQFFGTDLLAVMRYARHLPAETNGVVIRDAEEIVDEVRVHLREFTPPEQRVWAVRGLRLARELRDDFGEYVAEIPAEGRHPQDAGAQPRRRGRSR